MRNSTLLLGRIYMGIALQARNLNENLFPLCVPWIRNSVCSVDP